MTDFSTLKRLFPIVQLVSPNRPLKEIFASVLFVNDGRELVVTSFDGSMEVTARVPCDEHSFESAVPAKQLGRVISAAGDDTQIRPEKGKSRISFNGSFGNLNLATGDPSAFPTTADDRPTSYCELEASDFYRILSGAMVSVAKSGTGAYILDTIKIMTGEANLECHGSDGKRLSIFRCPSVQVGPNEQAEYSCIPTKAAFIVSKMLKAIAGERVRVAATENHFHVWSKNIGMKLSTVQGRFPDLYSVVDMTHDGLRVEVSLPELITAVENATIVCDEFARISLKFEGTKLTVSAKSDGGDAIFTVPIPKTSKSIESAFNASYLLSALKDLNSHVNEASIASKESEGLMTINRGRNSLHALMPFGDR